MWVRLQPNTLIERLDAARSTDVKTSSGEMAEWLTRAGVASEESAEGDPEGEERSDE